MKILDLLPFGLIPRIRFSVTGLEALGAAGAITSIGSSLFGISESQKAKKEARKQRRRQRKADAWQNLIEAATGQGISRGQAGSIGIPSSEGAYSRLAASLAGAGEQAIKSSEAKKERTHRETEAQKERDARVQTEQIKGAAEWWKAMTAGRGRAPSGTGLTAAEVSAYKALGDAGHSGAYEDLARRLGSSPIMPGAGGQQGVLAKIMALLGLGTAAAPFTGGASLSLPGASLGSPRSGIQDLTGVLSP